MAPVHGRKTRVFVNEYNVTEYFDTAGIALTVDASEVTTFLNDDRKYIPGLANSTISLSGIYDGDATTVDAYFRNIIQDDVNPVCTIIYGATITVGSPCAAGQFVLTSKNIDAPVTDATKLALSFQGSDGFRTGVVLAPDIAVDDTGETSAHNAGASSSRGGIAVLHVTENDRNGTVDLKIEHSADGNTWADLVVFTQIAASTPGSERVEFTGTVNQYTRVSHTLGGSSGEAKILVSLIRF